MLLDLTWLLVQFMIFTVVGTLSIILSLSAIKGFADFLMFCIGITISYFANRKVRKIERDDRLK